MNVKTCMTMMVLSVISLGTAYADNQDLGSQQGFISGGPGTMHEDKDVQDNNKPKDNNTQENTQNDQSQNTNDDTDHDDHSHVVLPVPMN